MTGDAKREMPLTRDVKKKSLTLSRDLKNDVTPGRDALRDMTLSKLSTSTVDQNLRQNAFRLVGGHAKPYVFPSPDPGSSTKRWFRLASACGGLGSCDCCAK